MNFSPLPQSFASDSVKLKSMKKGGKKIKTPEIERKGEKRWNGIEHKEKTKNTQTIMEERKDRKDSNKDQK